MPRVTLQSRLPEVAAELRPRVGRAVKEGAELIAEAAQDKVNIGPPHVHIFDHIEVIRLEAAGYLVVVDVADEKGVAYPFVVEFGAAETAKAPARPAYPFLIPAAEENADNVAYLVTGALRGL